MIQETGGHEGFLSSLLFGNKYKENLIVHIFSTLRYAILGRTINGYQN
jgi:hypothetical protein